PLRGAHVTCWRVRIARTVSLCPGCLPSLALTHVHASLLLRISPTLFRLARSCILLYSLFFFFSSRRRHTRLVSDWSSDVCSSDLDRLRRLRIAVLPD